jgi:hypothetical protein
VTLFHRTSADNAVSIRKDGFRDGEAQYLTDRPFAGVWFTDDPETIPNDGRGVLLSAELEESAIAEYEWTEEGKPYREWLIPAAVVNAAK